MRKKIDIQLKKQGKQKRSIETVNAIIEAGIYILKLNGPSGFTTHKVAEKAGVNIASFYQYYPNKEALLFHLTKTKWDADLIRLLPILGRSELSRKIRFREFVREFFMIEAEEADLRSALRLASVDIRETKEFKTLIAKGIELTRNFLIDSLGSKKSTDLDFEVDFIVTLTTSFAERSTDQKILKENLIRQADLLSDMISNQFKIR